MNDSSNNNDNSCNGDNPQSKFTTDQANWLNEFKSPYISLLMSGRLQRANAENAWQKEMLYLTSHGFEKLYSKKTGSKTPEKDLLKNLRIQVKRKGIDIVREQKRHISAQTDEDNIAGIPDDGVAKPDTLCFQQDLLEKLDSKIRQHLKPRELVLYNAFCKAGTFHSDDLYRFMTPQGRKLLMPKKVSPDQELEPLIKKSITRIFGNVHRKILEMLLNTDVLTNLRPRIIDTLCDYERIIYDAVLRAHGNFKEKMIYQTLKPNEVSLFHSMVVNPDPSISDAAQRIIRRVSTRLFWKIGKAVFQEIN